MPRPNVPRSSHRDRHFRPTEHDTLAFTILIRELVGSSAAVVEAIDLAHTQLPASHPANATLEQARRRARLMHRTFRELVDSLSEDTVARLAEVAAMQRWQDDSA